MSEDLLKVTLRTYSDFVCEEWMGQKVTPELLCAGANQGGSSGCFGDAGNAIITAIGDLYVAAVRCPFGCTELKCKYLA